MSALLDDVELSVLTAVIARGELLTNGDAQRLRGHIEALGEKYAAVTALAEADLAEALAWESYAALKMSPDRTVVAVDDCRRNCMDLSLAHDDAVAAYREATR